MASGLSRRRFATAGLALLGTTALGVVPGFPDVEKLLRFSWWGGQDRLRRTLAALELFEKHHPGIRTAGEAATSGGPFWAKLATSVVGHNAPDLYMMDYRIEQEYAERGAALPLDPYMPDLLDLGDWPAYARDAGKIRGKTHAVSLGTNSTAIFYDRGVLEKAGIPKPGYDWSWDDYARISIEITKATQGKLVGTTDFAYIEYAYQTWVRQRGKELYTEDGQLGYSAEDMAEWLEYWANLRRAGGTLSPEIQALDKDSIDSNGMVNRRTAMSFAFSNQFVSYQRLMKGALAINTDPNGPPGSPPGRYLKAALLACVYSGSKYPEDAVRLLDFQINHPEAIKIFGVERGIPPSPKGLAIVLPSLGPADRDIVDYVQLVAEKASSPVPPPPPIGATEIWQARRRTVEAVAFGMVSISQAAKDYVAEAKRILDEERKG